MPSAMDWVQRMQSSSLLAGYERPVREEQASPYVQLGNTSVPYDMNQPGVVRELKRALATLGALAADPLRNADPAIETRWKDIVADEPVPSWDAATADEFAIAVGRYRGWGWQVPEPYARSTPGGPQPTASGLELVAGAVNQLLGGHPRMAIYEQWREGTFEPPSVISGPPANAPVIDVSYLGPSYVAMPPSTAPDIGQQINEAERMLTEAHAAAMVAENETDRARHAATMLLARSIRKAWVAEAQAQAPTRTGETTVDPVAPDACARLGGSYDPTTGGCLRVESASAEPSSATPWIVLAVGALLVGSSLLEQRKTGLPPMR
jgi:hypothetical protein